MALLTANDVAVISASIVMPLYGVWSADLFIDQVDGSGFSAGTAVTIKADGGLELSGTVVPDRTGDFLDAVHVRVLGGKAGMAKAATVKGYVQPGAYVRDVLNALASDAGESLSSDIAQAFMTKNLTAWATLEGKVSDGLVALLDTIAPTYDWRVLSDGKLWVGEETWPQADEEYELIDRSPADRKYMLGVDTLTIVPGIDLTGIGKVNRVEHTVNDRAVRTVVFAEIEEEDRGIAGSTQALARQETRRLDYYAFYEAKVISQAADGSTVDLEPSDPRIPKLQRVPLRNGIAATVCKVAPGTFLRLGWNDGNPQKPFASLWQGGETLTALEIGSSPDNVLTKTDMTALISAITTMASTGNSGGPLSFTAPPSYSSNIVKVQR